MKQIRLLLLAPLALAAFALPSVAAPQTSSPQGWKQTPKTDSSRGPSTRFTLTGKFLKPPHGEISNRPALNVDCGHSRRAGSSEGRFVAGNLFVGAPLKIDYVEPSEIHGTSYYPKVKVRYRLDEGKEEKEDWTPGADKTSATFTKEALEKMLRAKTVEITMESADGSEIAVQFDVPDSTTLETACHTDVRKK